MSGVTYDDPKLRNLIRTDVYEKANEHAKKMFIGNDNDIKNYNKEFPQIPLYETTLGYSVRPTQNYPDDIYDWHEKVFNDENLAKKYLKGHPYSLGELTPEGRANFESEIKINKVVAVSPNAYPGITDNVRHDRFSARSVHFYRFGAPAMPIHDTFRKLKHGNVFTAKRVQEARERFHCKTCSRNTGTCSL